MYEAEKARKEGDSRMRARVRDEEVWLSG